MAMMAVACCCAVVPGGRAGAEKAVMHCVYNTADTDAGMVVAWFAPRRAGKPSQAATAARYRPPKLVTKLDQVGHQLTNSSQSAPFFFAMLARL
jgi:hypothetical protein